MKAFQLGERAFGHLTPYLIAEIGVNHEGDLDRAKRMIESVAKAGGHAAKFQTYKADLLATKDSSPAYWDQREEPADSQHALFQRWDTFGETEYRALADTCGDCGLDFLSTPFDLGAVDIIAEMSPAIKVASADATNIPLLRKVAATGLPVIMSLGAARLDEAATALSELRRAGASDVTLLHCVLNYPTPAAEAALAQIPQLQRIFGDDCAIGYSDHVKPEPDGAMPALEMAAMMGAVVIEKHFTDDKSASGNDHYHAMNADDLAAFVQRMASFQILYGSRVRDLSGQAQAIANARRRIVAARDIKAGDALAAEDLIALRSNRGVEVAHWDRVVGRHAVCDIPQGTPLEWAEVR